MNWRLGRVFSGRRKNAADRMPHARLLPLTLIWCTAVGAGLLLLYRYEHQPGAAAAAPDHWPSETQLVRSQDTPTLLLFAHPQCPCTRASLHELEVLLARVEGAIEVQIIFLQPEAADDFWHRSDLWRTAARIPGVTRYVDHGGRESVRFGADTSGQTLLYDASGRLVFDGGITSSRGHQGDNMGRSTVVALVNRSLETAGPACTSNVFGCPLCSSEQSCAPRN